MLRSVKKEYCFTVCRWAWGMTPPVGGISAINLKVLVISENRPECNLSQCPLDALKDVRVFVEQIKLHQTESGSPVKPMAVLQIGDDSQILVLLIGQVHHVAAGAIKSQHRPERCGVQVVHRPIRWPVVIGIPLLGCRGVGGIAGVEVPNERIVHIAALPPHADLPESRRTQQQVFVEEDASLEKQRWSEQKW